MLNMRQKYIWGLLNVPRLYVFGSGSVARSRVLWVTRVLTWRLVLWMRAASRRGMAARVICRTSWARGSLLRRGEVIGKPRYDLFRIDRCSNNGAKK